MNEIVALLASKGVVTLWDYTLSRLTQPDYNKLEKLIEEYHANLREQPTPIPVTVYPEPVTIEKNEPCITCIKSSFVSMAKAIDSAIQLDKKITDAEVQNYIDIAIDKATVIKENFNPDELKDIDKRTKRFIEWGCQTADRIKTLLRECETLNELRNIWNIADDARDTAITTFIVLKKEGMA